MKLKEIKPNGIGTVECVIVAIEEKTNRNNGTFLNIGISDGESQVIAKKWNEKAEKLRNLRPTRLCSFAVHR